MKKKTLLLAFAVIVGSASLASVAHAGWTNTKIHPLNTVTIPVQLSRGALVEYGRLVFTATVKSTITQTGHTAKWLKGYATDTRQCHWDMAAKMEMQYFVNSITGKQDSQPAQTISIPLALSGASNGLASIFDHDPCSDYKSEQAAALASVKKKALVAFDDKIQLGIAKFKAQMKGISIVINPS